jgi:hypothetical protein
LIAKSLLVAVVSGLIWYVIIGWTTARGPVRRYIERRLSRRGLLDDSQDPGDASV